MFEYHGSIEKTFDWAKAEGTVVSAALGAVFSYLIPLVVHWVIVLRQPGLRGDWLFTWEPKSQFRPPWVNEKMQISIGLGALKLKNHENEAGYEYECSAKLKTRRHLLGTWHSLGGPPGSGAFLLTFASRRTCLFGQIVGPNDEGKMESGRFVLGKNQDDLDYGKKVLEQWHPTESKRKSKRS